MGSPDSQRPDEKIGTSFWISLSVTALVLIGSLLGGWSGSTEQLALFVTTLFIASVLSDNAGRIPSTNIPFAPRHIAIFWAILNLGTLGGLAVAAVACLSSFSSHRGRRPEWTKNAFAELFAAGMAGSAYAAGLAFTSGFESVSGMFLVPVETLWASAAMIAGHFLATAAVGRLISQN